MILLISKYYDYCTYLFVKFYNNFPTTRTKFFCFLSTNKEKKIICVQNFSKILLNCFFLCFYVSDDFQRNSFIHCVIYLIIFFSLNSMVCQCANAECNFPDKSNC